MDCEKIEKENEKYIKIFENYLTENNLSSKVIKSHLNNIDLYLNDYLNYYLSKKMIDGIFSISSFFSMWYIEKCMFANKTNLKQTATSIKKFYKCMLENNYIKKEDYDTLCEIIKEEMEEWIELLEEFDNGDYYDFF